jgi:hypothetical protein
MKVERNIGGNVDVDRGMAQSDDAKWALSMIRIWKYGAKQRRNYLILVIRVKPGAAFGRVV